MATNGPLLFAQVDGQEPGSELSSRGHVTADVDLATIAPVEAIEIIVDGYVARTISVADGERRLTAQESIPVEGARWIAVRACGAKARYSGDNYTFAHTGPVYFTDAPPNDASRASADFLAAVVEEIRRRVDRRDAWLRPEDREVYRRHLDEALERLAAN